MNKLTEQQHLLKKSRFLKYSLLASISVGAIIAIPFEGMAMSKEAFRIDLSNKLNNLPQLNENKDTTNTPQQIGTVIVPEPEINTYYTPSEIREMKISNKPKASNPLKDVPVEDHYKVVARSKSDVGKARKVRPITKRKTFVGTEKTEQSQNTYTPEPTKQMPQKPEIIITASSPTVSPASNSFVTAPNTPNTTLISPEHYTTAPGTPSSTPATPYQPTSDSKPNDSLGANTPPNINTNSKAARRLSFSSSDPQQQTVQSSSQVKPEVPPKSTFVPLPIKKSSTEITAGMVVSNISRVNEVIGIKLAEVTQAIQKNTTDTKNTKPLQQLYTQLTSAQKTIEALKSKAEKIETQIKVGGSKNKIKKLEKELISKNNKADRLFQKIEKIDIPANKISIESQETVPVTTASTQVSAFQAQQARINEAQQGVLVQKNQQHIAAEKTKKQQQAEDKQRTEREKKKQGNIVKRVVSKVGSIVQTNDAENRKRKRDGETSKQRTVDQEGGFGHAWGNENHEENNLSVAIGLTERAGPLMSFLDAQKVAIAAILPTTSPFKKKSLSLVLQEIENDYQETIKISQELQQVLVRKLEDKKVYNKAEEILSAIESRVDKYSSIKTDADVRFNPNWGNSHSMPTANMNSLPNLVDSTIKKGTQPLSNLPTIDESCENLASETIYKTEQPKPSISYKNTSKRKLPIPLFRSAKLDKKLDYLDLEDKLLKVEGRIVKEKQAIAKLNQYQDPENLEFKRLAVEAQDLSSKESQLKEKREAIEAAFSLNEEYSSTDVSISRSYSFGNISSLLSDAESNLSRSPSVSGLKDLSNSNVMKLGELESKNDEKIANAYKAKVTESKPVFSCSVGSINSLSNGDDLSNRDVVTPVDTLTIEIDKDYVDTYIRVLSNKIQKIEELPGSSFRSEELNHIKEAMAYISNRIQDVEELDEKMLLAINALLQEHDEKISSLLLEKYTGEEAADILAQLLLQDMLVSDGKSESALPAGDEEQEDTEVTEVSRQLSSLPALASSNESALALSDDREKECLALGDGSEDEESYDSGFEEEEETIEQLSDSDGGNLKITEVDTAIPLEQEAKKEMQTQISENAPTLNQVKVVNTIVNNMIRNRLDASMNMSNNMVAVGAGDEEESHIKRGLWMRGMYGTNNHGRVDNMTGYRGTNKGATIGFDAEIDNNIVGIAYSNVHSVFKFKNSKNNDKELINSHVVSIYGQKELPKNFALQALVSASKNFIKDKTTYSYGDTKIRSNVKHRNHSYNAEALLHYNYLLQSKLIITPNVGLRYGKSRDGVYHETGINVQEIALTMKENNILSGIVGTKVTVPLKDALKFNNLGLTFQGAVEHNFKEKTQRINRVVKIFDNTFKHDYLIPKQPKTSYNLGTGIIGSIKNTTISLDYNYYLNKHYRSHQGSVKLKVNL